MIPLLPSYVFIMKKIERTKTNVKYVGNKAVIVPFDVLIDFTYHKLLVMIYPRTCIDKERFKLVFTCNYPLKSINRFQPRLVWDDNSVYRMLKLVNTTGMEEIELSLELV